MKLTRLKAQRGRYLKKFMWGALALGFLFATAHAQDMETKRTLFKDRFKMETVPSPDGDIVKSQDVSFEDANESRVLYEGDVEVTVAGHELTYHVQYASFAHFRIVETGHCGTSGCSLQCQEQTSAGHMNRVVVLKSGGPTTNRMLFTMGDTGSTTDNSCVNYMEHFMPALRNAVLGTTSTWQKYIDADLAQVRAGYF